MRRLTEYMQNRDMIRVVKKGEDIYFATVWGDGKKRRSKFVYRAAAAYYDSNQKRKHSMNKRIATSIKRANYVVYQTLFAKKMCEKILKARASKSSIIKNGFDKAPYADVKPYKNDGLLFLACSNWKNPAKRGDLVVKAFGKAKIPNARLVVLGGGITAIKSPSIDFIGSVKTPQLVSYLKAKPIFVHLGYAEVCPNVVVEALSYGCLVICNGCGGSAELVGDNGIVVKCDRAFKFKRCPVNYSLNNFDRLIEAFRKAPDFEHKVSCDDFTMEKCANKYLDVFKAVLS